MPSSTVTSSSGGSRGRRVEHCRHGHASTHPQDRPSVRDRPGRGPARLRLLLRAAQADGHPSVDDAGRASTRNGGRLGARPAPARDARRARADIRQVRPAALDASRRRPAGHRRRAPQPPGRRPPVPLRAGARRGRGRARAHARAGVPPLRRAADRRRLDRPGAPRGAPERRRGRRQGAAPERAAADRVGPRAALPGGAHDQGARPRARLHRRAARSSTSSRASSARSSTTSSRRATPTRSGATSPTPSSSSCRRSTGTTRRSRMLTLEFLDGVQLADLDFDATSLEERRELAYRVTETWMEMIFRHGFFHGDPHPANVLVLERRPDRTRRLRARRQADRRGHGAADAALHRRRDRERRRAAAPARRARRPLSEGARGGVPHRAARALLPLLRRQPRRDRPDPGDPRGVRADLLDEPAPADALRPARQGDRDARRGRRRPLSRTSTSSRSRARTRAR